MRGQFQKWMKQTGALVLASMLAAMTPCSIGAQASGLEMKSVQYAEKLTCDTEQIHLDYSFGVPEFEVGSNGYQILLDDSVAINEAGMPDLPAKTVSILLPKGKTVKSVKVKKENVQVYKNMLIAPAMGFEKVTGTDAAETVETTEDTEAAKVVETVEDTEAAEVVENTKETEAQEVIVSGNTVDIASQADGNDLASELPEESTESTTEETLATVEPAEEIEEAIEESSVQEELEELDSAQKEEEWGFEAEELAGIIDFTNSDVFNQSVYSGLSVYPGTDSSEGMVETTRGFTVYSITLYPMSYTGTTLTYCSDMSLDLTFTDADEELEYIPTKEDLEFLSDDIDTTAYESTYFATTSTVKTGKTIAGKGKIDYIIITNKALSKTFQRLADYKASKGLRTAVVTTEKIYKKYKGYDKAEKVRKFIQDAYTKNRVKYILLGGDGDGKANSKTAIVPTRMLYCKAVASGEKPTYIASDVYYSCLSGTYDSNKNHKYGEKSDAEKGNSDVDLTADVYVGRAPVDDVTEAENFITKVINYETREKSAQALMIGEQLSGNISCSVEIAANLQSDTSADSIVDAVRKLRDEKIKQEYIELYYDANEFMKEVYLNDLNLLGKTVKLLVDYRQPIEEYVQGGKTSKIMAREDIRTLQNYCQELAGAIRKSEQSYRQKERLAAELISFTEYLGNCEGMDFGTMLDNSQFCRSEKDTVDTAAIEKLDTIYGGTYKEEIRLGATTNNMKTRKIPDTYTVSTLYDKDSANQEWTEEQLLSALNASPELINHLGHANVDKLMRLDAAKIRALSNENAFFFYSQGCYAGSFDNRNTDNKYAKEDCVAEELLVSSPTSGAFACVVNSRYGWYNSDPSSTKGPSQLYDRMFWDVAMYGSDKSLGAILAKSRQNKNLLGKFNDKTYGAVLRYCFYEITLLGDPETKLHDLKDPLLEQTTLSVQKSGKNRTLTWTAVEGAQKYIVYRSTSKNGTYTKLKATKKLTFTDTTAKKGKKYYYKVAAYKKVGSKKYYRCSNPKKS